MIKTAKDTTRRLLDVHGWSGILLGLALYVVVFTGSIVVFIHEIGVWSVSGEKMHHALALNLDTKIEQLAEDVPEEYFEDVNIWQNAAGYLVVFFHTHFKEETGALTEKGVRFTIDPTTMEVVNRQEGTSAELPIDYTGYLVRFFLDLHIRLHAPGSIGLYLTGILGLVLLVSSISGLILHRHLIKDMFLSPRLSSRLLNTRDRHNLAGTWSILFSIILAFTGAFYSFALTIGLPVIAITAFEGDQQKAIETVLGTPAEPDMTPADFIGLGHVIDLVQQDEAAGSVPFFIAVEHWGRADAVVSTIHSADGVSLSNSTHQFNGVTGEYLGEKPALGKEPSLGNTLVELMGVLHFGWFAGLLSRVIWISLGLATCYVTLTGLQLWVQRREESRAWRQMARLLAIVGYGTPVAMCTAAMGFILSYASYPELVKEWTIQGFFAGVILSFIVGLLFNDRVKRGKAFQWFLGAILIILPLVRLVSGEQSWLQHWQSDNAVVLGLDISLLLSGLISFAFASGLVGKVTFTKDHSSISHRSEAS